MKTPYSKLATHEDETNLLSLMTIDQYQRCHYCHTELILDHELNLTLFQVIENSHCPGCGVHLKPRSYSLN